MHPALRPRRSRWPWVVPSLLVFALAAGWVAIWYWAAAKAEDTVEAWRAREAAAGIAIDCTRQAVSGFPFSLTVHCHDVRMKWRETPAPLAAQLREARLSVDLFDLQDIDVALTAPLEASLSTEASMLAANWSSAQARLRGTPQAPREATLVVDAPELRFLGELGRSAIFQAKSLLFNARSRPAEGGQGPVVETAAQLGAAHVDGLGFASGALLDADLKVAFHGLQDLAPKPLTMRLRELHDANGRIEIMAARLQQGSAVAEGSGTLTVSAQGHLNGDVRMIFIEPETFIQTLGLEKLLAQDLARRLGPASAKPDGINALIGALDVVVPGLGNVARKQASATVMAGLSFLGEKATLDGRPALALPVRFVEGVVFLGPVEIAQLPALF